MKRRFSMFLMTAIVALLCSIGAPSRASAGGWAVTSLDPLPTISPGEPATIGFTILQHGRTPVLVDDVTIDIRGDGGEVLTFAAEPGVDEGRYTATVTFPDSGEYSWTVHQGWFGPQELGTVRVFADGGTAGAGVENPSAWHAGIRYSLVVASIGMVAMGALEHLRSRRRLVST